MTKKSSLLSTLEPAQLISCDKAQGIEVQSARVLRTAAPMGSEQRSADKVASLSTPTCTTCLCVIHTVNKLKQPHRHRGAWTQGAK
jgi:hypothetical protein